MASMATRVAGGRVAAWAAGRAARDAGHAAVARCAPTVARGISARPAPPLLVGRLLSTGAETAGAAGSDDGDNDLDWHEYLSEFDHDVSTQELFEYLRDNQVPPEAPTTIAVDKALEPEVAVPKHFTKVALSMKGYDHAVMDAYVSVIIKASKACGIRSSGRIPLPTQRKRHTVLKGPHVHKQHRDQFETRTHRRLVEMYDMTGETASAFLDYLVRLVPPGLELKLVHTTAERPTGDLATALGMQASEDPVVSVGQRLRFLLGKEELAKLTIALQSYRNDQHVKGLCDAIPICVLEDEAALAGLRAFVNPLDFKEFDIRVVQRLN